MTEYDLIVLGAGPGGYTAASCAASLGMKTLLVEKGLSGGTCLNRGCIPTKALLYCAERYDEAQHGEAFGVSASVGPFDYIKAAAHRDSVMKRLRTGVDFLVKRSGAERIAGEAELVDENRVKVGEETFGFENLIIATGSIPAPPPFAFDEEANLINSDAFLSLDEIPQSVMVIGGGVIGLEFATILAKIGRTVTVIEAMDRVLPPFDAESARIIRRRLEKEQVTFYTSAFVKKVEKQRGKTVCAVESLDKRFSLEADLVVCAVGRIANTRTLHTERLGLSMRKSFIQVDDRCMTSVPHIYAVGDVNGKSMLAHAAMFQGEKTVENIYRRTDQAILSAPVPACVYTDPEIASVGLTREAAAAVGYEVKVGRIDAIANGKMLTAGVREGFVQLVADSASGKILGCQMVTPRATDMIAEIALAIKLGATAENIADTIHPHPTISEMIADAARSIR